MALGMPGWVVRDKRSRRDWDLNLEKLGMSTLETCEA